MRVYLRRLAGALLVIGLVPAVGGRADEGDDALRAREAVRAGRFVPLEQIVAWVGERYHGRLLEVELDVEDEDEEPTYEVEWLTPQGHVLEFEFDARDGTLLEIEGRGIGEARRD